MLPVPLFHCFGIVLGVLAILTHGGTLVMIELFDPLLVLAAVEKERCTALYGVPTMFIAEFTHPCLTCSTSHPSAQVSWQGLPAP